MSMSLPSFAQAFSSSSLSEIVSNALPPIQSRQKRARTDAADTVRIKEEDEPPASPPLPTDHRDDDATPAISSKKRRVTAIPNPSPPASPTLKKQPAVLTASPPSSSKLPRATPPSMAEPAHSLPPPPISFARRRAAQPGARKKKPADILISPRSAGPSDPLAPVIQSAPPLADRFPMAIPRLPTMLSSQTTRRVATNVPPTPTRFSLQGSARTMPSPPNPSVPIANTLVPPTPHALHHQTGDKAAFLAPFEVFYDALCDSKQLKTLLADQLQKSTALMAALKQQQEKMDEIVEDLVEKRTRAMRDELALLRQRMESLEEALLAAKLHQNEPPSSDSPPVERRPDFAHSRSTSGPRTTRPTRLWSYPPGENP